MSKLAGQAFTDEESAMRVIYESETDLAQALRRAEAAHGRYEEQLGHADPDWPAWYAQHMINEQPERPGPAGSGAGA
jgi:hypothetical protein